VKVFRTKTRSIKKKGSYETCGYAFDSAGVAVTALWGHGFRNLNS
jgi:hypothetical protein